MKTLTSKASAAIVSCLYARDEKSSKLRILSQGAALSAVFVLCLTQSAEAATDLKTYATQVSGETNIIVDIISYVCYIGGAGLAALGIVDLKKHVENPSQNPVKNGVAKLGFGGILLALPFVTTLMQGTTGVEDGGATIKTFSNKPTI